jgi:hypothetical protein
MSTAAQLINRTQRQLLSGVVEERNKLAVALTATATSCVLTYEVGGIRSGTVIEVGSEQLYVWAIVESTKTLTVERGFNGTTAVAHVINSIITAAPRFPRNQILEAINDELSDLASPVNGLFQVKTLDLRYNPSSRQINLPAIGDIIDLIEVRSRYISDDHQQVNRVKLLRNMPTKDFGSGTALQIDSDIPASEVRVTYKAPFTRLVSENDDIQTIAGYPLSAEDILVIGAEIRLVAPREMKRNFTESQGDTRRSDEVGPGAVGGSITNLLRMRRDRVTAEAAKLNRQYPVFLQRA